MPVKDIIVDTKLFEAIQKKIPKVNDEIIYGIANKQVAKAEKYIDAAWVSIASALPKNVEYHTYRRCTPEEEFNLLIKRYNSNEYQMDVSDIFICTYMLKHTDKNGTVTIIDVPIALPYLHKGGQLRIRNTRYTVSPVLSSNIFRVETNSIRIKLKMEDSYLRLSHRFYCGNDRVTASVVYSQLHRGGNKYKKNNAIKENKKTQSKPKPVLMFYLLIEYGLTGLFKHIDVDVIAGYHDGLKNLDPEKWIICSAHEIKPSTSLAVYKTHAESRIKLAVEKQALEGSKSELTMSLVAGFFYILDHFPDRINLKYVNEKRLWKLLLGICYFGHTTSNEGILIENIDNHLNTLSEYIDVTSRILLKNDGIEIENLYELFFVITEKMQSMVWSTDPTSLYGKKLITLQFLLREITNGITNFMFKVLRLDPEWASLEDIRALLKTHVKVNAILFKYDENNQIDLISSPCDIFSLEHTTKMIPQAAMGKTSSHVSGLNNPANLAHISIAEVGSYTNLHGSDATGRGYLNPYVQIADDGTIIRNEKFRALTEYGQQKLRRQ